MHESSTTKDRVDYDATNITFDDPEETASDLLACARSVAPIIDAHGQEGDTRRALAPGIVKSIRDQNLTSWWVPEALGGPELSPLQILRLIEELSYADGSTGWVVMAIGTCVGGAGAFLADAAVEELFGGGEFPHIAGQGGPQGQATVVDGGFALTGRWSYGSGVKHSEYVHCGAVVIEDGAPRIAADGYPEMRAVIVPRDQVELGDNWHVMGLRGTGSIDYSADALFVPEEFSYSNYGTTPERGGPCYRLGILGVQSLVHSAFALGVARRALDELASLVQTGGGRFESLAVSESFQEGFADAEVNARASRAFLYDTWRGIQRTVEREQDPTTRETSLMRVGVIHATRVARDVCEFAYSSAGGIALRESTIQRCFRDIHAATQHICVGTHLFRGAGRELAGLAHGEFWHRQGLVPVRVPVQ